MHIFDWCTLERKTIFMSQEDEKKKKRRMREKEWYFVSYYFDVFLHKKTSILFFTNIHRVQKGNKSNSSSYSMKFCSIFFFMITVIFIAIITRDNFYQNFLTPAWNENGRHRKKRVLSLYSHKTFDIVQSYVKNWITMSLNSKLIYLIKKKTKNIIEMKLYYL